MSRKSNQVTEVLGKTTGLIDNLMTNVNSK